MNGWESNGAPMPAPRKGVIYIEPIKPNCRHRFRIYSPVPHGVWTHYHDYTSACYKDHNKCVNGHDATTLRWKGYVLAHHFDKNKLCFVQVTSALVYKWQEKLATGTSFRGQMVFISRGAKKNSPQNLEIQEYGSLEQHTMPPDFHPRPSIYNMWKEVDPGWEWSKNPMLRLSGGELAEEA